MCTEEIEGEITRANKVTAKIEEALVDINCITRNAQGKAKSQTTSIKESVSLMS